MNRDEILIIVTKLQELYPPSKFPLESDVNARDGQRRNFYKVLTLFLLSVGTSDKTLVKVCCNFFDKFPKADELVSAPDSQEVLGIITSVGRQNKKLLYIEDAAQFICRNGNRCPEDLSKLRRINGVGNKVFECILAYGCGKPALPIDGNVLRVLYRIRGKDPAEGNNSDYNLVREKLKQMLKPSKWIDTHELLRLHGIAVCKKGQPQCHLCPLEPCQYRKAPLDRRMGIWRAREEAKRILDDEWEPWRRLICDP